MAIPPPPNNQPEPPRRRSSAQKRKAAPNFASSTTFNPPKRLIKERNALYPLPTTIHNGPVTRARQSPIKLAALQNAPCQAPPLVKSEEPPVSSGADPVQEEEEEKMVSIGEPLVDIDFEAVRSRGSNVHAVPTHTGWFSWKTVHQIEKQTMASFFNGKSENRTPELYMDIRNLIMKKFHNDPETLVEVKDLSELSVGDLDARKEVLEFLDHWGLINFHPFPPPYKPDVSDSDADGVSRASSLIEKLYQFETVQSFPSIVHKKVDLPAPAVHPPSFLPQPVIAGDLLTPVGPSVEYHCNSCSTDCSRKRYHCQKQADFDLCAECYSAEKFGSGMTAADFILMEPADVPGVSSGSWTDQEALLLLEALELFGGNWSEIAEHVATKTKDQCMLHFIQMPIEDPFLEGKGEDSANILESKDPSLANKESESSNVCETKETESAGYVDEPVSTPADDSIRKVSSGANVALDILKDSFQSVGYFPEQGGIISFKEAGNPVMALAAFLAGLVEPGVATTSTRSSLKAILEDSPAIQLATRHCSILEDPPNDKTDPPEPESMDSGKPHGEEDQMPMSTVTIESKDCVDKNEKNDEKNDVQLEKETEQSNSGQDFSPKPPAQNELGESVSLVQATHTSTEDSGDQSLAEEQIMPTIKDASISALPIELTSTNAQESGDLCLQGEDTESIGKKTNDVEMAVEEKANSTESTGKETNAVEMAVEEITNSTESTAKETNDVEMAVEEKGNSTESTGKETNDVEMAVEEITNSTESTAKETNDVEMAVEEKALSTESTGKETNDVEMAAEEKANSFKELEDTSNAEGMKLTPAPLEGQETQQTADTDSTAKSREKAGDDDKKTSSNDVDDKKNCDSIEMDSDHDIGKLKRAAVTALSAAAVKAKLLSDQEEDEVMQLVSLVIEKQLHKLETKLSLFTEMESMIMRTREQIDRARQRLIQERQQIVAARLGLTTSSQPPSKIALGYGSSTPLRPPSIGSLKLPFMRRP